jgi:hypothetical protein
MICVSVLNFYEVGDAGSNEDSPVSHRLTPGKAGDVRLWLWLWGCAREQSPLSHPLSPTCVGEHVASSLCA